MENFIVEIVEKMVRNYKEKRGKEGYMLGMKQLRLEMQQLGNKVWGRFLEQVSQETTAGQCPKCGKTGIRNHCDVGKTLRGIMGEIKVYRDEYWCLRCKKRFYPFDQEVGVGNHGQITFDLQEVVVRNGMKMAYKEVPDNAKRDYNVNVSANEAHRLLQRHNIRADLQQMSSKNKLQEQRIYVSTDGVLVRANHMGSGPKWAEIRTGISFSQVVQISHNRNEILDKSYYSTGKLGDFEKEFREQLSQRKVFDAQEIILWGDGAIYINSFYERVLKPLETTRALKVQRYLDPYHIFEKISERLKQMYPEEETTREQLQQKWVELSWQGHIQELINAIFSVKVKGKKANKAQDKLLNYFIRNREYIPNYKELQAQGIVIGSGTAEKTNDVLVARRMKKRGMTWTPGGRHSMVRIRTIWFNQQWDQFWSQPCIN